jgi:hypothetical protein
MRPISKTIGLTLLAVVFGTGLPTQARYPARQDDQREGDERR